MRMTPFFKHIRPFVFLKRFLPKTLLGRSLMIIVTPLIVAFLLAQRRFIEGITLTGMK